MKENYSLPAGDTELERLAIMAELYNPGSVAFLKRSGVSQGSSLMEIGCGHGMMLKEAEQIVGPDAHLIAVDHAQDQLDIVKQRFVPTDLKTEAWKTYWFQMGEQIGANYLFCDEAFRTFNRLGLTVERFDLFQPVSYQSRLKALNYLAGGGGGCGLKEHYIEHCHAVPEEIEAECLAHEQAIQSPDVYSEHYKVLQFALTA